MKLTEAQARKVVSDIYEQIHGEQLYHATNRKFFADWIAGKKNELSMARSSAMRMLWIN